MKKIIITVLFCLIFVKPILAQTVDIPRQYTIQDITNPDNLKIIDKKLIQLDTDEQIIPELNNQINLENQQIQAVQQQFTAEHQLVFAGKNLLLSSLIEIQTYRTIKRPLFIKIITLGIVRDKHDHLLDQEIIALQNEITNWK